jgi:uncharacterized protein YegL
MRVVPIHMLLCGVLLALLPAFVNCAAATAAALASSEALHARHHYRRHGHRHHHHSDSHNEVSNSDTGDLSLSAALDQMPAKVVEMFTQLQSTKDVAKAVDVLAELNLVFERALTQKDTLTPDCEDKKADLSREVSQARDGLKDVEDHLTRLQGHMQSVQGGIDRNLAEVESIREQYEAHKKVCKKNKDDSFKMLALLQADMPVAKNLTDDATAGCKAGTAPPVLTECSMPNGEFVTTFKEGKFRDMITKCSGITEKIIALNLDRAVRTRVVVPAPTTAPTTALIQMQTHRLRGVSTKSSKANATKGHKHRHHRHHRQGNGTAPAAKKNGLLQRLQAEASRRSVHRSVSQALCTDVAVPPSCEAFSDSMATFYGNVEDLVRDLLGKAQSQEDNCRTSLESYEEQVKALRRQADDGSVALANAASEHSQLEVLRRERRAQVQDINSEADREVATCGQQLSDFDATICSAKKLKKEMGSKAGEGAFMGDCEVGDWIRGPCNETCGEHGMQEMTRDVISSPGTNPKCPSLKFMRACNRKPCPVDGVMGYWEAWSGCSRACGGGTRSRHRSIISEAKHGGLPVAETMQEQLCNTQACDQDCLLADWTPFTNCSKVCNRGHMSRTRKVIRPPLGDGTCPDERSVDRLQTSPCAKEACDNVTILSPTAKCSEKLDMAVVLDVSGSVGADNVEKLKLFTTGITNRMTLGPTLESAVGATLGLVYYGSKASVASPLTGVSADVISSIATVLWQKDSTNTAQALGVTRSLFEQKGRAAAKQVAIVVTDGMPESAFLTGVEVGRLKEQGVRLVFVAIGKSVSQQVLRRWASWPWEENVITVNTYGELDAKRVTEVLANVCGQSLA